MTDNTIRARQRQTQLHDRTASTLQLLTDIYRDDDWKLLTDPTTKTPFRTFTTFVATELSISAAYARRYQQTIRDLVLPTRHTAGPAAAAAITLADTERLGRHGIATFLEELATNPITADDPEAACRARLDTASPPPTPSPDHADTAAEHLAAEIPTHAPTTASPPPWNTPPPDSDPTRTGDQLAPTSEPPLLAAITTIASLDPTQAATHLHPDNAPDLARAALTLTQLRAHLLATQ